jgi:hypothetical protein
MPIELKKMWLVPPKLNTKSGDRTREQHTCQRACGGHENIIRPAVVPRGRTDGQSSVAPQNDVAVAAEQSHRQNVTEFMNQYRDKHDHNPEQHSPRIPRVTRKQERYKPEQRTHPDRRSK